MTTPLLPQTFWFRLAIPCRRIDGLPRSKGRLLDLRDDCRLPDTAALAGATSWADVRAAWSPAAGWTFGFDQYTTGSASCGSDAGKCVIWPQATSIHGAVDASAGTITLAVPRSVLFALGPNDAHAEPS